MKKLILPFFVFTFIIYLLTSAGNTPYDYFTRLADAFISGQYWLSDNPPWLNELIPAGENKFFVVYPPMPAILLTPFVIVFGKTFPQQYLAHFLGAGLAILTAKLSFLIKKDKKLAVWSALLISFGSIVWFLAATGSVWYLGQLTAAFFLTAAMVEALGKKRLPLVSIFLGMAYLSRVHTILSFPFFLYLLKDNLSSIKKVVSLAIPLIIVVVLDAIYNFVRFQVPWNAGYFLIPGIYSEPWFSKGIIHPSYIIDHIKIILLAMPKLLTKTPFIQPSWGGMAIWLTTPAFVFSLKAPWKKTVVKFAWLSIFLIFLIIGLHGSTGFAQFGYRFAVDFYPFLIFLTIKGVARRGLGKIHWVLLFAGILVNLWGVLWINKFGWVSF